MLVPWGLACGFHPKMSENHWKSLKITEIDHFSRNWPLFREIDHFFEKTRQNQGKHGKTKENTAKPRKTRQNPDQDQDQDQD